jgi:hypothetical protein
MLATDVFVNDNWFVAINNVGGPGPDTGDIVDNRNDSDFATNPQVHTFGVTAFSTIQAGVNAVDVGGNVHVLQGSYAESVVVNKSLDLLGARAGVDARGRTGIESTVTPSVADELTAVVYVTAANVTVDGFTINGDGAASGGVAVLGGATSNAARGIGVDADNVDILNNRVSNVYRRGVQFGIVGNAIGGLVNQNDFDGIGATVASSANSGDAVLAFADPTVTNNEVTNARTGITLIQVYAPHVTPIVVSGNNISAINGIALNETSSGVPIITIADNVVTTQANGVGLQLWTIDGTASITGNHFAGAGVSDIGVYAWDGTANDAMNVTITGGTINAYATGVLVTNEETFGPFGVALNDATVTLAGVSITGGAAGGTGAIALDTAAGTTDVTLGLTGGSDIANTTTGLRIDGPLATLVGNTLNDTAFVGQSGNYIALANLAYGDGIPNNQQLQINATAVTFDGKTGAAMTPAERQTLESKLVHEPDDGTLGFILVDAVNSPPVIVTNAGSTVAQGGTDVITQAELNTTDAESLPEQLTYTVTVAPTSGTLRLSGAPTSTFTQADINAGNVTYVHSGSATTSDSFTFTVSDGVNTVGPATFNITITPVISGITVTVDGDGNLIIEGTSEDDIVTITGVGTGTGTYIVTTQQGVQPPQTQTVTGVTDDIRVNLHAGNDQLTMNNIFITGSIIVDMESGNDTVTLGNSDVVSTQQDLDVDLGTENDVLNGRRIFIAGDQILVGGDGDDDLIFDGIASPFTLSTSAGGSATWTTGIGDDSVHIIYAFIVGAFTIDLGAGNDSLDIFGSAASGDVTFVGGAGVDGFIVDTNFFDADQLLDGGDNDDTVFLANGLGTDLGRIITGGGADSVTVRNETQARLNIDTGSGADTVDVRASALDRFFAALGDDNDSLTIFGNLVRLETDLDGGAGSSDRLLDQGNDLRGAVRRRNFELFT